MGYKFFMSTKQQPKNNDKRIRPSMKKDVIRASDFNHYKIPYFCEACSHFKSENQSCTLGFQTFSHLKANADQSYFISGKIAQCRFLEID